MLDLMTVVKVKQTKPDPETKKSEVSVFQEMIRCSSIQRVRRWHKTGQEVYNERQLDENNRSKDDDILVLHMKDLETNDEYKTKIIENFKSFETRLNSAREGYKKMAEDAK